MNCRRGLKRLFSDIASNSFWLGPQRLGLLSVGDAEECGSEPMLVTRMVRGPFVELIALKNNPKTYKETKCIR